MSLNALLVVVVQIPLTRLTQHRSREAALALACGLLDAQGAGALWGARRLMYTAAHLAPGPDGLGRPQPGTILLGRPRTGRSLHAGRGRRAVPQHQPARPWTACCTARTSR
ncbi:MAG: hypothetical protein LBV60_08170 [Streptomyces sp.]|jgi:hypothetical protein|nr:hypothetical protein [Streptomyces sp.]